MQKFVALLLCVALVAQISAVPLEKPAVAKRNIGGALGVVGGLTGVAGGLVGGLVSGVLRVVDLSQCLVDVSTQCTQGQQCVANVQLGGLFCATIPSIFGRSVGRTGASATGSASVNAGGLLGGVTGGLLGGAGGLLGGVTGLAGGLVGGLVGVAGGLVGGLLSGVLRVVDLSNCLVNLNTQCAATEQCVLNVDLGGVFCATLPSILGRSGRTGVSASGSASVGSGDLLGGLTGGLTGGLLGGAGGLLGGVTGLAGGLVGGLTGVVGGLVGGLLSGVLRVVDLSNCLANVNTQCTAQEQCLLNVELGGVFCAALGGLGLGNLLG